MELPIQFLEKMKNYLGCEYEAFIECFSNPPAKGIRINPLKSDADTVKRAIECVQSPFSPLSYYIKEESKVGRMPLHAAGAFYSQEPSASSAVTVLAPRPGDKVLDMCAAPGGKSTQIAALLDGKGLLWSNEAIRSRANILLSNIERMGVRNAVVSSAYPDVIERGLAGYFDKVLVDAPCSGEGMFRKNPEAVAEWSGEHVASCAVRQRAILNCAAGCVREGGVLVYSTCTFSLEENEYTAAGFLKDHPEFEQAEIRTGFGRPGTDGKSLRIMPMDGGEGHFIAKFIRRGRNEEHPENYRSDNSKNTGIPMAEDLYKQIFKDPVYGRIESIGQRFVILPDELPELKNLGVIRAGVLLGESAGKRMEPHHSLFMAHKPEECRNSLDFSSDAPELQRYLHGEEVPCETKGYTGVSVSGVTLGFGKASGGMLKNKYPKGLRF